MRNWCQFWECQMEITCKKNLAPVCASCGDVHQRNITVCYLLILIVQIADYAQPFCPQAPFMEALLLVTTMENGQTSKRSTFSDHRMSFCQSQAGILTSSSTMQGKYLCIVREDTKRLPTSWNIRG